MISRLAAGSTIHLVDQAIGRPVDQSISQIILQLISRAVGGSISRSVDQSISRTVDCFDRFDEFDIRTNANKTHNAIFCRLKPIVPGFVRIGIRFERILGRSA